MIGRAKLWISRCVKQQALSLAILLLMFASLVYGVADAVQGIERGLLWLYDSVVKSILIEPTVSPISLMHPI